MKKLTKNAIALATAAGVALTVVLATSAATVGAASTPQANPAAATPDQLVVQADGVGNAQAAPAKPAPKQERTQYAVQTLNIKSNPRMPIASVRHDLAMSTSLGSDVIMLQEIKPKDYKQAVEKAKVPGKNGGKWQVIGLAEAIPIMVRVGGDSPWEVAGQGKERMHDGLAKVSPHRMIMWVVLKHKTTGEKTVFMNTHFVSGAWGKPKKAQQWRKQMWETHFNKMSAKIREFHQQGLSVVFGGDFNRRIIPNAFAPQERWIVKSGIDKIGFVPATNKPNLKVTRRDTVKGFKSDHNAKIARFSTGAGSVNTEPPKPEPETEKAGGSTKGGAADPDSVQAPDGKYYTIATKAGAAKGCKVPKKGFFWVPMRITKTADLAGTCAVRDALPEGPGKWAYRGEKAAVWAPSIVQYKNKWFLFYSASKAGTGANADKRGQMCIGKAEASKPQGPYKNTGMVVCPGAGRWAIDPDAFVDNGKFFLVYRDDSAAPKGQSGISGVQLNDKGEAMMKTRQPLLTSLDVTWETKGTGPKDHGHIIENPTMMKINGRYRLFFSGNTWASKRYSTGLADCGTAPINNRCTMTRANKDRPWFGYSKSGLNPQHTLPPKDKEHMGPGGMAIFKNNAGQIKAVWHWWPNGPRPAMMGTMQNDLTIK